MDTFEAAEKRAAKPLDTFAAAKKFAAETLAPKLKSGTRAVVLLFGEMGAGKTAFVSCAVKHLLPTAHPSSPTFTIINQYADNVFHMDLYRIKDENELDNIGFYEILEGAGEVADDGGTERGNKGNESGNQCGNIVFIEWAEKVTRTDLRAMADYAVTIKIKDETTREVTIESIP